MSIVELFEFYETPAPFTRYLFNQVDIRGRVGELCCGDQAIIKAAPASSERTWITNDLHAGWPADYNLDATEPELYDRIDAAGGLDWHVSNPPFNPAIDIVEQSLARVRVGVAMHLRISINEPLKTGKRRDFLHRNPPTGVLFLPRFAYQRSKKTGEWSTDSVAAAWLVWLKNGGPQFIRYAPPAVIDQTVEETPSYRARMDKLMARMRASA